MSFLQLIVVIFLLSLAAICTREPAQPSNHYVIKDLTEKSSNDYIVQKGDSLYAIGFRFGIDYQKLAEWNQIEPPYWLDEGQSIRLSPLNKYARLSPNPIDSNHKLTGSNVNNIKKVDFDWQWPLKGKLLRGFSAENNNGIDIMAKMGQSVYAAGSGKVVHTGDNIPGYGNLLIIKHNDMYLTAYANNHKLLVKLGDDINKGQPIAEVGAIGDKVCLHFEIRKNGNPVNPIDYLPDK